MKYLSRTKEAEQHFAEQLRRQNKAIKPCLKTRPSIAEMQRQMQYEASTSIFSLVIGLGCVVGFLAALVDWLC